jgi:hypothetical protein
MKKILLALLLVTGFANATVNTIKPINNSEGPYKAGRLIVQQTGGGDIYTDQKTGCQWFIISVGTDAKIDLGCFPEFISEEFKK